MIYLSAEAAQIDILNIMNIISTDPSFNKEMVGTIRGIKVYKDKKATEELMIYIATKIGTGGKSNGVIPYYKDSVQSIHTHGAANTHEMLESKVYYNTEVFSKRDIDESIKIKLPLSLATPGDSQYTGEYGEPKIYIYYPDTQEVHYFGKPATYKDGNADTSSYKIRDNKDPIPEKRKITIEIKK